MHTSRCFQTLSEDLSSFLFARCVILKSASPGSLVDVAFAFLCPPTPSAAEGGFYWVFPPGASLFNSCSALKNFTASVKARTLPAGFLRVSPLPQASSTSLLSTLTAYSGSGAPVSASSAELLPEALRELSRYLEQRNHALAAAALASSASAAVWAANVTVGTNATIISPLLCVQKTCSHATNGNAIPTQGQRSSATASASAGGAVDEQEPQLTVACQFLPQSQANAFATAVASKTRLSSSASSIMHPGLVSADTNTVSHTPTNTTTTPSGRGGSKSKGGFSGNTHASISVSLPVGPYDWAFGLEPPATRLSFLAVPTPAEYYLKSSRIATNTSDTDTSSRSVRAYNNETDDAKYDTNGSIGTGTLYDTCGSGSTAEHMRREIEAAGSFNTFLSTLPPLTDGEFNSDFQPLSVSSGSLTTQSNFDQKSLSMGFLRCRGSHYSQSNPVSTITDCVSDQVALAQMSEVTRFKQYVRFKHRFERTIQHVRNTSQY